ncbi:MAG: type II secretion system F family protein [Candidatus Nezhaarchaeales archaeon]
MGATLMPLAINKGKSKRVSLIITVKGKKRVKAKLPSIGVKDRIINVIANSFLTSYILHATYRHLKQTTLTITPYSYAIKASSFTLTAAAAATALSIALLLNQGGLIPLLIPPLTMASILLVSLAIPRVLTFKRAKGVEEELPFFAILASVFVASGLSILRVFNALTNCTFLGSMRLESLLIRRDCLISGSNPLQALEDSVKQHPSNTYRELLLSYTSVLRSGGDVVSFLNGKVQELLRAVERRWKTYASSMFLIGDLILALFLAAPLMLSMSALALATPVAMGFVDLYSFTIIPMLTLTSITLIHIWSPKTRNNYANPTRTFIVATLAMTLVATILRFTINPPLHIILPVSLTAFSIPLTITSWARINNVSNIERALPAFLRDITEYRKMGQDLKRAILTLAQRRFYNKHFNELLNNVVKLLGLGIPFNRLASLMDTPSFMARVTFFILAHMAETGSDTPILLESLTRSMDNLKQAKEQAKANLKLQMIIGYLAPVIVIASVSLLFNFIKDASVIPTLIFDAANPALIRVLLEKVKLAVAFSSVSIGLLIAKASDATLHSLRHLLGCLISYIAALTVFPV